VRQAYLLLVGQESGDRGQESAGWNSRGHFFEAAAEAMRRILIERAQQRVNLHRGGRQDRLLGGKSDPASLSNDTKALAKLALEDATVRSSSVPCCDDHRSGCGRRGNSQSVGGLPLGVCTGLGLRRFDWRFDTACDAKEF